MFQPRPMEFGEILSETVRVFGRAWQTLVVVGLFGLIPTLVGALVLGDAFDPAAVTQAVAAQDFAKLLPTLITVLTTSAITLLLMLLVYPLQQGALISASARAVQGQPVSIGEAVQSGLSRYVGMLGTTALISVLAVVAIIALAVVGLGFLSWLTIPVGLVFLGVKVSLAGHVLMLEGAPGGLAPLKRAWGLSGGRFWNLLGVLVVLVLAGAIISAVVSAAVGSAGTVAIIIGGVVSAVTSAITFTGLTVAYYDTLARKNPPAQVAASTEA